MSVVTVHAAGSVVVVRDEEWVVSWTERGLGSPTHRTFHPSPAPPARADQEGPSSSCAATAASTRLRSSVKPGSRSCAVAWTTSSGPVAMHDPVAQTGWLAPGDARELLLQLIRQLCSGFAEHGEVPQQRVAADPICSQVLDRDAINKAMAWTPAWIISSRSRTSRRIQGLSLRQYRCA